MSCGMGVKKRKRECTNPSPSFGGQNCIGVHIDNEKCQERYCPSKVHFIYIEKFITLQKINVRHFFLYLRRSMLFVKILFITSKIITDNYLQRNNKQTKDMIVKNRYFFLLFMNINMSTCVTCMIY